MTMLLDVLALAADVRAGRITPREVADLAWTRAAASPEGIWITRRPQEELRADAAWVAAQRNGGAHLPLAGVPFAVKDNIDVAGLPTTAACPAFAYNASQDAPVVARLRAAGALVVGKTNMDQFATGLVGVRSPYGIPKNPFDERAICGGSSSGSAAAVSTGQVSFALGTDTAGSGRVPAAFTNIVGLKPSRGFLPTRGVVPACRSLDCVSVFAHAMGDAAAVADVAAGFDTQDAWSQPLPDGFRFAPGPLPASFRFGVPVAPHLEFFDDAQAAAQFGRAVALLRALGGTPVEIDLAPFLEAAALLYEGPYVAERRASIGDFLEQHPGAALPVIETILGAANHYSAVEAFTGTHRLQELRHITGNVLRALDALVVPTTPTHYTIEQVAADPLRTNARLGRYTNFVNLLDLSAVAVPSGFRRDGLPAGVTVIGPRGSEPRLGAIADALHRRAEVTAGATGLALPPPVAVDETGEIPLVVLGAHLSGQPLNHQLVALGARLVRPCRTAPHYRLYALPTKPPKPGLVRVEDGGATIEGEVWAMSAAAFGRFVSGIPGPLGIGTLELDDGSRLHGFLCEAVATKDAPDITHHGGWRSFLRSRTPAPH